MEKIALVTGASRGIGRAVARQLAADGYAVGVNYRVRQDCADSLVSELTASGCRALALRADVSDRAQVNDMVRRLGETFSPVELVVNNAGVAGQALFQDITDDLWHRYFGVNVDGAFHTIQAVLPAMLHAHDGCIVNVSSIWGLRGASCEVTYSATKGALIALTRSLASELDPPASWSTASPPASSRRICSPPCRRRCCPSWPGRHLLAASARRRTSPPPSVSWQAGRRPSSPDRSSPPTAASSSDRHLTNCQKPL